MTIRSLEVDNHDGSEVVTPSTSDSPPPNTNGNLQLNVPVVDEEVREIVVQQHQQQQGADAMGSGVGIDHETAVETNPPVDTNSWSYIASHDTDTEMVQRWKESKFAVGLTHASWKDEPIVCCWQRNTTIDSQDNNNNRNCCTPLNITAICCRNAGRVGNMVVLYQYMESYHDPVTSTTTQRPRLKIVLGPYWMVLLFITVPVFSFFTCLTGISRMRTIESTTLWILYIVCTCGLFTSLLMVGCRNPGILYRHTAPPPIPPNVAIVNDDDTTTQNTAAWLWNDQALSYRPKHAKYDTECAALIEKFDHTCPWTGTAIGKNNMSWFRCFCFFVIVDLLFNALLLTTSTIGSEPVDKNIPD